MKIEKNVYGKRTVLTILPFAERAGVFSTVLRLRPIACNAKKTWYQLDAGLRFGFGGGGGLE